MARIIYSALVSNIRGSIAGTTFQNNAYGYTAKVKSNIVKPNSVLQNQRKIFFSAAVKAWAGLTSVQRDTWVTWAATYPQYAKNNPSVELSGFHAFVKYHALRFLGTNDISDIIVSPVFSSIPVDTPSLSLTVSGAILTLSYTWTNNTDVLYCLFYVSRVFAPSTYFVGSKTRFVLFSSNSNGGTNIASEYIALYGLLPTAGQIINVDAQLIGKTNGQVFARQRFRLTVS